MARFTDGYTGQLYEEEVLGCCIAVHRGYMRWAQAIEEVRTHQPRAKTPVAAALEREVRRQAGSEARFYTAVRSTLDVMHGCDAFFEYCGVVVTIDLTINPHKDCGKADVIISRDDVADLAALAGRITREIHTKLRRRA